MPVDQLTLSHLFTFAQLILIPAMGYGLKILWDIREHLAKLNGRVGRLEAWTVGHENLDNERTETLKQAIRDCPTRPTLRDNRP